MDGRTEVRRIRYERLVFAPLAGCVKSDAVRQTDQACHSRMIELKAQPGLVETLRGDLDEPATDPGLQEVSQVLPRLMMPQRREGFDPEALAHGFKPCSLIFGREGTRRDSIDLEPYEQGFKRSGFVGLRGQGG